MVMKTKYVIEQRQDGFVICKRYPNGFRSLVAIFKPRQDGSIDRIYSVQSPMLMKFDNLQSVKTYYGIED